MVAEARFEALYRAYAGGVRGYALRRSDEHTADEVVADVFAIVWRRLADVPAEPLPWMLGIARRVLANQRRSAARERALKRRIRSEQATSAPAGVTRTAWDDAVLRALGGLSEVDRETLLLVAWEGLGPMSAAQVLGVRPNTFVARLCRARRRFERALAAQTDAVARRQKVSESKGEVVR